jgi:hypothetical protein
MSNQNTTHHCVYFFLRNSCIMWQFKRVKLLKEHFREGFKSTRKGFQVFRHLRKFSFTNLIWILSNTGTLLEKYVMHPCLKRNMHD